MNQTLRILHCMRAPVGGLFRHVLDLAGEQAARGHEVGIVADSNAGDRLTAQRFAAIKPKLKLGIALTPMSRMPGLGDLGATRTVYRLAASLRPDVLHGHGAKGGAYARLAASLARRSGWPVKSFYTPHGGTLHYRPSSAMGRVFGSLEGALGTMTGGFIFESDYAYRLYSGRLGPLDAPARVIHNGLQPDDFVAHTPSKNAADFVFIGELRDIKGVDVLLQSLARLNTKRPVTAVLVGSGPDSDELQTLAKTLGLAEVTNFPGPIPAREAFNLGRCLVVPSRGESFPYVVLEAGAAGIPLIATNVGGIPEIVAGTDTELIPAGDETALALAMKAFLDDPVNAALRAATLNANVAEKFSVESMTSAVLGFYREA